jgi:hypothetical protein
VRGAAAAAAACTTEQVLLLPGCCWAPAGLCASLLRRSGCAGPTITASASARGGARLHLLLLVGVLKPTCSGAPTCSGSACMIQHAVVGCRADHTRAHPRACK